MAPGAVVLTRRPPRSFLLWSSALGLALGAGSTLLINGLMAEPSWTAAGLAGLVLGALVPLSVAGGSRVRIDNGVLTYALRGTDCVEVTLADITGTRLIATGALRGVGLEIPPAQLRFLSRKGPTLRACEAHFAATGCGLVLEFLTAEDLAVIEERRG